MTNKKKDKSFNDSVTYQLSITEKNYEARKSNKKKPRSIENYANDGATMA